MATAEEIVLRKLLNYCMSVDSSDVAGYSEYQRGHMHFMFIAIDVYDNSTYEEFLMPDSVPALANQTDEWYAGFNEARRDLGLPD